MAFLYPSLFALGCALVALPFLVHLLTRRRRQEVAWPAMDFLLQSYKLNKTKMQLQELLLMLLRMLVVLLGGLLAGGPIASDALEAWFRAPKALHLVVLDDSYSMGQAGPAESVWSTAKEAIKRIAENAAERSLEGRLVVVRYSDMLTEAEPSDFPISATSEGPLNSWLEGLAPSYSAASPVAALREATTLAQEASADDQPCYAYVLSDFRKRDHMEEPTFVAALSDLADATAGLVLGPCYDTERNWPANLTIESLELEPGPAAAKLESTVTLHVRNHGQRPTEKTLVRISTNGVEAPAIELNSIGPGEQVERSVAVYFERHGPQVIRAELAADSLLADNTRVLAIEAPERRQILILDGSRDGLEGRAFATALRPRLESTTGWAPNLVRAQSLESIGDLSLYEAVLLLEPPRLSVQARQELARFAEQGGGLLFALGPRVAPKDFNSQFASKESPIVPFQLDLPTQPPVLESGKPALVVNDHPALRLLAGEGAPFLNIIKIVLYHGIQPITDQQEADEFKVLASLPDGAPFLVESQLGKGRVLTLLATAVARDKGDRSWSNLATLPIFPLLVNDQLAWLTVPSIAPGQSLVGVTKALGELDSITQLSGETSTEIAIRPDLLLAPGRTWLSQRSPARQICLQSISIPKNRG